MPMPLKAIEIIVTDVKPEIHLRCIREGFKLTIYINGQGKPFGKLIGRIEHDGVSFIMTCGCGNPLPLDGGRSNRPPFYTQ
jgi:hypothetical protein